MRETQKSNILKPWTWRKMNKKKDKRLKFENKKKLTNE